MKINNTTHKGNKQKKNNTRQCCRLEVVNSKLIRLVWGTVLFKKKNLRRQNFISGMCVVLSGMQKKNNNNYYNLPIIMKDTL